MDGGALGAPIKVDGIDRHVAILHSDSANWIASSGGNVLGSNYRFDFNAHEVGHLVGDLFSFDRGRRGQFSATVFDPRGRALGVD